MLTDPTTTMEDFHNVYMQNLSAEDVAKLNAQEAELKSIETLK